MHKRAPKPFHHAVHRVDVPVNSFEQVTNSTAVLALAPVISHALSPLVFDSPFFGTGEAHQLWYLRSIECDNEVDAIRDWIYDSLATYVR